MTAKMSTQRLSLTQAKFERLTHYLFRYSAKFHPPIARTLVERYSQPGDHVLDPFCGSGSLLVECAVTGRHATGSDVDSVAVFVSRNKIRRLQAGHLSESCSLLADKLQDLRRTDGEYLKRQFSDLTLKDMYQTSIPKVPRSSSTRITTLLRRKATIRKRPGCSKI